MKRKCTVVVYYGPRPSHGHARKYGTYSIKQASTPASALSRIVPVAELHEAHEWHGRRATKAFESGFKSYCVYHASPFEECGHLHEDDD